MSVTSFKMTWKSKIEQLVGLLEKVPQPHKFESKTGVYQPYFIIELRSSNWEITASADYTRLDGSPGREVRLTLAVVDSSKVNISQNELDGLVFLESGTTHNSRQLFNYAQPVGFLLDWLRDSRLMVKAAAHKPIESVEVHPNDGTIILSLRKDSNGYVLQPILVFPDGSTLELDEPATVLTANPIYMLYKQRIYCIESALPAVFWSNYFRTYENFVIPGEDLGEFVKHYLHHVLPVLDWKNLEEFISQKKLRLSKKLLTFTEWNQQLGIDIRFQYGNFDFAAYPEAEQVLATHESQLFIVKRDLKKETGYRKLLEDCGLIYRSGNWHIAADYHYLDWMRDMLPKIQAAGFTVVGEDTLTRHRVHRKPVKLRLRVKSGVQWLDLKYSIMLGREAIEIPDLMKQLRNGKGYLKLSDGSFIYPDEAFRSQVEQLSEYLEFKNGRGNVRLPMAGVAMINELASISEEVQLDTSATRLVDQFRKFQSIASVGAPNDLVGELRKYQEYGLDWLNFLNSFSFGGILADDMGLGKTVQVISLLLHLKTQKKLQKPALIIVPLTLVFNWRAEIEKFGPSLKTLSFQGSRSERSKLLKAMGNHDVILCSYGVALQDQRQLATHEFSYLVLDESQKVKNPDTKTYKAITKLQADRKLALTGTPVENSLMDLWAQFNIVNSGLLGTQKQFEQQFIQVAEDEREQRIAVLKKLIYPFILRRTKEQVERELPPLTEIVQYIEMTDAQRAEYNKWLQHYRTEVFDEIQDSGINKARFKIVEALTYLRQIACHPAILEEDFDLNEAGKTQVLEEMLTDLLDKGHKILIFSQFVRFLKLVRTIFEKHQWRYEYLDGKVRDREQHIRNFQQNSDISAFLISLKAGGVGLNLTAADYVVHLDPWWNPAVERQATDRAHRIGQDKRVFVYKYIVKGTVEEKILQLQEQKKALSAELITTESGFVKHLSKEDLDVLFASEGS